MAHTQYAGMRQTLPSPTVAAVSGGNLSGSGTVEISLQGRNRAGWNLPTALQAVAYTAGQRIKIDLLSTMRAAGEDIHEYVMSIATTSGNLSTIRQVAVYQGYDTDQVTATSLPATIYLSEDEHIAVGSGQTVADVASLPSGNDLIHGMIRQVTALSKIYEYDINSTATADGSTVLTAATGRWLAVSAFSTYVTSTTAAGGCDESLNSIDPNTVIQPPAYPVDGSIGTAVRYWYFGTRDVSGDNTAEGTRVNIQVFDDGIERSRQFDGLLKQTFSGYADPSDGTLDTAGMTTGVQGYFKFGKSGAWVLEKALPAGEAAEFAIAPAFSAAQISDVTDGSKLSINLRAFNQSGDVNPLSGFVTNAIPTQGNLLRVVPDSGGVQVLSGAAAVGTLSFPLIDGQAVTGLSSNTANQYIHINGNGAAFVGDGTPGNQEAIRAKVSTVSGRSDPTAFNSYTAVTAGDTLTVTITHNRDVRADYPEPSGAASVIAGNSSAAFTPPQVAVYLQRESDGNIYEFLFSATDTATQDVTIANIADGTLIGSVPTAASADYSLFEPGDTSFTSPAGSSDLTATNYRTAAAYVYDGGQATKIQHSPHTGDTAADWLVERDLTGASDGGQIKYRYNATTSAPPAAAEIRLNAGATELYISTTAQDSVDAGGLLDTLGDGSRVAVFNLTGDAAHRIFAITANADNTSYHTLTGSVESSNGTLSGDVAAQFFGAGGGGGGGVTVTVAETPPNVAPTAIGDRWYHTTGFSAGTELTAIYEAVSVSEEYLEGTGITIVLPAAGGSWALIRGT